MAIYYEASRNRNKRREGVAAHTAIPASIIQRMLVMSMYHLNKVRIRM